ncbi:MAG: SGNH/GDSL hydrolase family protein [Magnetospirillum sp.]|nr:SGNH/GDSL hydrolase family protein [Magnetospirillum sp.]
MKRLLFSLMSVLLVALVVFVGMELALRIALARSMDFDIEMWKYAGEAKQVAANPAIGHEHRPGAHAFLMGADVAINSRKLRDREDIGYDKPAGVKRVLMLGDSLAFGWGVDFADTTSKLAEGLLRADNMAVEVINTGVGNYNTAMEVATYFDEGLKYQPDVVVLNYFINDAEPTPKRNLNFWLRWSYAYVWLKGRLDVAGRLFFGGQSWQDYYGGLYAADAPGFRTADESIRRLAEACRTNGTPLVIAHYPELHNLKAYPFAQVSDWLARTAAETGAIYVDLLPAVRDESEETLWVTPADPHPNAKANRLFAAAIHQAVKPLLAGR